MCYPPQPPDTKPAQASPHPHPTPCLMQCLPPALCLLLGDSRPLGDGRCQVHSELPALSSHLASLEEERALGLPGPGW